MVRRHATVGFMFQNQPLLIKISPSIQNPINYHYMLYSALDIVEEKSQISQKTAGLNNSGPDHRDLYLGLLYPSSDEVKMCRDPILSLRSYRRNMNYFFLCRYAYCTNTKVKIILIVDATNTSLKETDIRNVSFRRSVLSTTVNSMRG